MTPQFADRVDPIFREVFQVLDRIDQNEDIRHEEVRKSLVGQLATVVIEGDVPQRKALEWRRAIYAITCWIDEMLIDAYSWDGNSWWKDNPLERDQQLFGSLEANSRFYEEDSLASSEDAVESFYVCALLGFQGLYGSDNNVNAELRKKLGLPGTQSEWVESRRRRMEEFRNEPGEFHEVESRQIDVARPQWRWTSALMPWVFVWMLILLCRVLSKLLGE